MTFKYNKHVLSFGNPKMATRKKATNLNLLISIAEQKLKPDICQSAREVIGQPNITYTIYIFL